MGKRIFPIFIIMYFVLGVSLGKGKHPCPKSEATDEGEKREIKFWQNPEYKWRKG